MIGQKPPCGGGDHESKASHCFENPHGQTALRGRHAVRDECDTNRVGRAKAEPHDAAGEKYPRLRTKPKCRTPGPTCEQPAAEDRISADSIGEHASSQRRPNASHIEEREKEPGCEETQTERAGVNRK